MVMREGRATRERGGVRTDRAIYVNIKGDEVGESDATVHAQAYAAGAMVNPADAVRYGLARSGDFEQRRRNPEAEDDEKAFVDIADHRRLVGEFERTRGLLNEANGALDRKDDEIEQLTARIDALETKIASESGKETKPDKTDTDTGTNKAEKPNGKPATTAPKETKEDKN